MYKHIARVLFIVSLIALCFPVHLPGATSNKQADVVKTSKGDLRITPIFHGSVMLEFGGKVIHVDPWGQGDYTDIPQADLIVITHTPPTIWIRC